MKNTHLILLIALICMSACSKTHFIQTKDSKVQEVAVDEAILDKPLKVYDETLASLFLKPDTGFMIDLAREGSVGYLESPLFDDLEFQVPDLDILFSNVRSLSPDRVVKGHAGLKIGWQRMHYKGKTLYDGLKKLKSFIDFDEDFLKEFPNCQKDLSVCSYSSMMFDYQPLSVVGGIVSYLETYDYMWYQAPHPSGWRVVNVIDLNSMKSANILTVVEESSLVDGLKKAVPQFFENHSIDEPEGLVENLSKIKTLKAMDDYLSSINRNCAFPWNENTYNHFSIKDYTPNGEQVTVVIGVSVMRTNVCRGEIKLLEVVAKAQKSFKKELSLTKNGKKGFFLTKKIVSYEEEE